VLSKTSIDKGKGGIVEFSGGSGERDTEDFWRKSEQKLNEGGGKGKIRRQRAVCYAGKERRRGAKGWGDGYVNIENQKIVFLRGTPGIEFREQSSTVSILKSRGDFKGRHWRSRDKVSGGSRMVLRREEGVEGEETIDRGSLEEEKIIAVISR